MLSMWLDLCRNGECVTPKLIDPAKETLRWDETILRAALRARSTC